MKTTPISYPNTSKLPNDKYQISVMLTHFFSLQRVLPRRIQQKFFNFIQDKLIARKAIIISRACKIDSRNISIKTFFNFTYKRYRFHFGIYTPCSHNHITPGFSDYTPAKSICKVPALFLMSDFRRACVLHQPTFFKNDMFTHIKNPKKELNIDITDPSITPKAYYHANLLYTHWNTHRTKRIYSQRSGISYEETIHAHDRYSINHLNNKHIYRKRLNNFSFRRSHNPRVSKTQEIRFDRAKRRIFHMKEHNPLDHQQHRFATAQRYQFMFTESQFVLKPIKHLLYNQGLHHRNYKFWTPFFGHPGRKIMTNIVEDTLSLNIVHTVAPYNPIPNMFILRKYRNIIPKEPLYTADGIYIVPGSREWFTYMYNLHINLPPPLIKAQHRALRLENEHIEVIRKTKEDAILHGTSFNRVNRRIHLAFTLTLVSERVHYEMTDYTNDYLASDDDKIKSDIYEKMTKFTALVIKGAKARVLDSKLARGGRSFFPSEVTVDTSDDAKELELRPKKKRISSHTNLYPLIDNTDRFKRRRFSPAVMDNSTGAELY
ncbi:hypothetical protein GLOIN_2v1469460 [Rhizophagus irregularis DAOM 181602=DAOM 197198]|uniref:DUF8211 domain-containing protein n=2 Tax=Rhizophagus irregularis TaxID=588596 RepID=A0A2H5TWY3_RHIID|nr:hypothetical protein GLOIN_2v1469460 [Rhizophagus irregularis DAOM 181602=DAOM 197198]POG82948.1 hypothetical protein GLOIN_2v1469460 [Rhizophagus irregularis DAOM 181602=DAOM 197198]|eukprot:XP_025189814.1 hypothetical protein GLOIN_2v1469460 [Rhizophagus irregularis DAOM 181602=DAOM 197198]